MVNQSAPQTKPLILVDGSSYLFRAYHALPELSTGDGRPTGAVRGVIGMLRKLAKDYPDSPIAVVFDAKGKTFRNDLYAEYKANRPPMPGDLAEQIEPIHEIIRAMGLPLLIVPDVEADDVIGTLAAEATHQQRDTVISTGDKDMAQLVSDHVTLVNTMTDTRMDRAGVVEKFGVPPELIIDYLALTGDSVDNIPGVDKVGPKTAAKWLGEHGSLEAVMAAAGDFPGKLGENLRAALDHLPLSRELTRIRCDVPLDVGIADLVPKPADEARLQALFADLEFNTWLEETGSAAGAEASASSAASGSDRRWHVVDTWDALDGWIGRLADSPLIAMDTETTSLAYMAAKLVGFSFCVEPGESIYVPVAHDYPDAPPQLPLDGVLERLRPLLEDDQRPKVGQNLKYDISVLARHGVQVRGVAHDTMLESYVLNSTATRHDMDSLALKYLNIETIHYEDVAGKGAKQIPFNEVSVETAAPYAAEDADIVLKLHRALSTELETIPNLAKVYRDIEIPLLSVLAGIERNGVIIDDHMLLEQAHDMKVRMQEIEAEAHDMAGESFNIGSPKQIQAILYDKMELPVLAKTPKGQPSTAESVLQDLAADYALPKLILDYRSLSKLCSTYNEKLPQMVNKQTGRLHTSYHQAVTATGRLSSSEPNLQNIPIRTAEGRKIRQAFIAPKGYTLVAADYSQIELRIMAHLSGDGGLVEAFAQGQDIHKITAAEVFSTKLDEVTADQRRAAKAINFGLIYGMSAFGLAKQLGIQRGEAQEYVNLYFERYPGVKLYMETTRNKAKEAGYVETV
ncbi:MAG: DNA polymerase I, partial [Pseudomonadales bacterium]